MICNDCNQDKAIMLFPIKKSNGKPRPKCKECTNRAAYRAREGKSYKYNYGNKYSGRYSEYRKVWKRSWVKRNKKQNDACQKFNKEAYKGNITRRSTCEVCCSSDRVQAHHHDYNQPLNVTFLCLDHHMIWHSAWEPIR